MEIKHVKALYPDTWILFKDRYLTNASIHEIINSIETEIELRKKTLR